MFSRALLRNAPPVNHSKTNDVTQLRKTGFHIVMFPIRGVYLPHSGLLYATPLEQLRLQAYPLALPT